MHDFIIGDKVREIATGINWVVRDFETTSERTSNRHPRQKELFKDKNRVVCERIGENTLLQIKTFNANELVIDDI